MRKRGKFSKRSVINLAYYADTGLYRSACHLVMPAMMWTSMLEFVNIGKLSLNK